MSDVQYGGFSGRWGMKPTLSRRHPLNELLCFTAVVVALSSAAGGASPATNG
jgi:hypothetical protein